MNILVKIYHLISFLFYYLKVVLLSNISIAADILSPRLRMSPEVVDLPLKTKSEAEILTISNLLTMTPGSLVLGYDREKNMLKVHIMYYRDPGSFYKTVDEIQNRIEKIFS
jgi:multicomponent Na+:H+ antiporter subunit E